jgi:hypothetical protein
MAWSVPAATGARSERTRLGPDFKATVEMNMRFHSLCALPLAVGSGTDRKDGPAAKRGAGQRSGLMYSIE